MTTITIDRAVVEQALEALESVYGDSCDALHALRAALAQQAEPVQRKPLTEEEIIDATEHIDTSRNGYFIHIARAVERAHGITDPQVEDRLARHGIPMPDDENPSFG